MKTACVLGGHGMIGMQLVKRLKSEGYWVRSVDVKEPEFAQSEADQAMILDLREPNNVSKALWNPNQTTWHDKTNSFDEVYQLAADMGGALYVFTGVNDADIIYDSTMINLNVAKVASQYGVKKLFFSSSACAYSERLQESLDCASLKEDSAWDGKPDSVYGIEKLLSEQIYDSFRRNKGLDVRIGRFHNIFSPECTYKGGREKAPAAVCRKVAEASDGGEIEIFGDGLQQRSFLYIDECLDGVKALMDSDYVYPVNIGSDEMISINDLAKMVIKISGKTLIINNVESNALGVRGRNSNNELVEKVTGWRPTKPLEEGMVKLYNWIELEVNKHKSKSI
jgi:nucleoside-diphosphate-sugar epimerase